MKKKLKKITQTTLAVQHRLHTTSMIIHDPKSQKGNLGLCGAILFPFTEMQHAFKSLEVKSEKQRAN